MSNGPLRAEVFRFDVDGEGDKPEKGGLTDQEQSAGPSGQSEYNLPMAPVAAEHFVTILIMRLGRVARVRGTAAQSVPFDL